MPVKRDDCSDYDDKSDYDDDVYIEPDVRKYGRDQFGEIASPYLTPYVINGYSINSTLYGRRDIMLKSATPFLL
jgi:hypothetical protein